MNFAWSFKPIFVWLFAILGLDLDESKKKSRCTRHLSIFVCLFWAFGVKIPYYSYRMYQKLTYVKLDGKSFIVITNNKITLAMNGLMYIWFHIALMVWLGDLIFLTPKSCSLISWSPFGIRFSAQRSADSRQGYLSVLVVSSKYLVISVVIGRTSISRSTSHSYCSTCYSFVNVAFSIKVGDVWYSKNLW